MIMAEGGPKMIWLWGRHYLHLSYYHFTFSFPLLPGKMGFRGA